MWRYLIGIQDFDIRVSLDVRSRHSTLSMILDVSDFLLVCAAVVSDRKRLDVHDNFRNILFNAGDGTELMQDAVNLDLADSCAGE